MSKSVFLDKLNEDQLLVAESPLLSCTLVDSHNLPLLSATLFADNIVDSLKGSLEKCSKEVRDEFGDCFVYFTSYAAVATVYNKDTKKVEGTHIVTPYKPLHDISISLEKLCDEFERVSILAQIELQILHDDVDELHDIIVE